MTNARPEERKTQATHYRGKNWLQQSRKKAMTNRTRIIKASRIAATMSFLLFFPARFAHARYSSRMIDRFLNWGDHAEKRHQRGAGNGL